MIKTFLCRVQHLNNPNGSLKRTGNPKQKKEEAHVQQALEHALKSLLLKKPFHKITINDITEECGVSRMTFYYHFKDIYDLVEWSFIEDAARALE